MITEYKEKTLFKDLKKIDQNIRTKIKTIIFEEIPAAQNFNDISNIKKIKGYKYYFRKKMGVYRIGFKYKNGIVTIMRALQRRDIYRYFP